MSWCWHWLSWGETDTASLHCGHPCLTRLTLPDTASTHSLLTISSHKYLNQNREQTTLFKPRLKYTTALWLIDRKHKLNLHWNWLNSFKKSIVDHSVRKISFIHLSYFINYICRYLNLIYCFIFIYCSLPLNLVFAAYILMKRTHVWYKNHSLSIITLVTFQKLESLDWMWSLIICKSSLLILDTGGAQWTCSSVTDSVLLNSAGQCSWGGRVSQTVILYTAPGSYSCLSPALSEAAPVSSIHSVYFSVLKHWTNCRIHDNLELKILFDYGIFLRPEDTWYDKLIYWLISSSCKVPSLLY